MDKFNIAQNRRERKRQRRQLQAAMMLNRLALIETQAAHPGNGQPLAERIGALLRRNRNSQPIPFDGRPVPYDSDNQADNGLQPEA